MPVIEEDDNGKQVISNEAEYKELNEEDFFEELLELADVEALDIPIFEVYQKYFGYSSSDYKPICLTSLIDPDYDNIIGMEDKAEHYHILPYGGGWDNQPHKLVEAFDCIRSAKIQYNRVRTEKIEAKFTPKR